MNSKTIRKHNTAVLFHAIRQRPGISQTTLQSMTAVDRSTISAVVHQLETDGLLKRSRGKASYGMGRPEAVLSIEPDAGLLVGFALLAPGALRLVAAGLDGVVRTILEADASLVPHDLSSQINELLPQLLEKAGATATTIRGAGLLLASPRASREANPTNAHDLTRNKLENVLGCPLNVASDVQGFALAERYAGSANGLNNFIYIYSDGLVRGALFLDGRLHQGLAGMTERFGHIVVEPHGRIAEAGGRGALNAYASKGAILERLAEFGRHFRSLEEVTASAINNDALVKTVLAETGSYLGVALANAINLLDIGNIVLGGDLARLGGYLMPAIRDMISRDVVGSLGQEAIVRSSQLGADPTPAGAIALAMESFLPLS